MLLDVRAQVLPLLEVERQAQRFGESLEAGVVFAATGERCPRCWVYRDEVGTAGREARVKCEEALG